MGVENADSPPVWVSIGRSFRYVFTGLDGVLVIEERLARTMQSATGPQGAPDQGVDTQDAQPKRSGLRRLFSKVVGERTVNRDEVAPKSVELAPKVAIATIVEPVQAVTASAPAQQAHALGEPVAKD